MGQNDNWFLRGFVPEDEDPLHVKAVTEGIVPDNCLMGGVPIWQFHEKGIDICQLCSWPRHLCHGRPQRKDGIIETALDHLAADHSPSVGKQLEFDLHIRRIEEQLAEDWAAPKEKKK